MRSYLNAIKKGKNENRSVPSYLSLLLSYPRWIFYLLNAKNPLNNSVPWLTFKAIDFLKKNLHKGMKAFEYGGGSSTLFFANRVGELVTVEHNKDWFTNLRSILEKRKDIKWEGQFIEGEKRITSENLLTSDPDHYFSEDPEYQSHSFEKYASYIDKFPDSYFDVVLVDGRARPSCIKHSLSKVKKGGLLILDNAERPYYLSYYSSNLPGYELVFDYYGPAPYINWFTQTNIWRRI